MLLSMKGKREGDSYLLPGLKKKSLGDASAAWLTERALPHCTCLDPLLHARNIIATGFLVCTLITKTGIST